MHPCLSLGINMLESTGQRCFRHRQIEPLRIGEVHFSQFVLSNAFKVWGLGPNACCWVRSEVAMSCLQRWLAKGPRHTPFKAFLKDRTLVLGGSRGLVSRY